jgi:hypothetical protein
MLTIKTAKRIIMIFLRPYYSLELSLPLEKDGLCALLLERIVVWEKSWQSSNKELKPLLYNKNLNKLGQILVKLVVSALSLPFMFFS